VYITVEIRVFAEKLFPSVKNPTKNNSQVINVINNSFENISEPTISDNTIAMPDTPPATRLNGIIKIPLILEYLS